MARTPRAARRGAEPAAGHAAGPAHPLPGREPGPRRGRPVARLVAADVRPPAGPRPGRPQGPAGTSRNRDARARPRGATRGGADGPRAGPPRTPHLHTPRTPPPPP